MFKSMNAIEFTKKFYNNDCCYEYLVDKKWRNGYSCSYCGCKEYFKGRTRFYRRCKHCKYDESVTANTVFHGMKMPIVKAFHIVFRITVKKKGMSTTELGAEVGVQQKTAWLLKRKVQAIMKDKKKLNGSVDVDETLLGGYSAGKENRGRSLSEKAAVLVAAEQLEDGRTGNINFAVVDNFEALTLKYALKDLTEPTAKLRTDKHQSYQSLKGQFETLETLLSAKGSNFEELHKQIMMFKNWLRGIHHKCSKEHLHAYLDEYKYRFNKRNMRNSIFNNLINRMMNNIPHPYPALKTLCAYST